MNAKTYMEQLRMAFYLTEPAIAHAMDAMQFNTNCSGLDVGCGIGLHTRMLAQRIAPNGHVTGLDLSEEHLASASKYLQQSPYAGQAEFVHGDLLQLPFEDNQFDWVWCSDTLWPHAVAQDPVSAVRELVRVIKPGGWLNLLFWSAQQLLPGYPKLEARLQQAFTQNVPYFQGDSPILHHMRAQNWLMAAGCEQVQAHSHVANIQSPLDSRRWSALPVMFNMLWGNLQESLSEEDWNDYTSLCDQQSPMFILDNTDYYGFIVYSSFTGIVK